MIKIRIADKASGFGVQKSNKTKRVFLPTDDALFLCPDSSKQTSISPSIKFLFRRVFTGLLQRYVI